MIQSEQSRINLDCAENSTIQGYYITENVMSPCPFTTAVNLKLTEDTKLPAFTADYLINLLLLLLLCLP